MIRRSSTNPTVRTRIANATMTLSIVIWFSALGLAFVKFMATGTHRATPMTARIDPVNVAQPQTDDHPFIQNQNPFAHSPLSLFTPQHPVASIMTADADRLLLDSGTSRAHARAHTRQEAVAYNGRPLVKVGTIKMKVTAYSPDERSCGIYSDGVTASGHSVWTNDMNLVAADTRLLPFGTILTIPGYNQGKPVPVLDRGGAIKGYRLDVLYPTHEIARQWGVRDLEVDVWEYAD